MTRVTADRAAVLRLRPIVHASPVRDGIHVRGAQSSFTMNGGTGLWRLWQALSVALADGRSQDQLSAPAPNAAVGAAIAALVEQLHAHDMLVEVPAGWGELSGPDDPPARLAGWLAAVAPDPAGAWQRIRRTAVTVGEGGPLASAAARALSGAGVGVIRTGDRGREVATSLVLTAGEVSVGAVIGGEVGLVTPTGSLPSAHRDAGAIAERIGLPAGTPAPTVLAALVGAAAAHRLVCAVAGLPDPGQDPLAAGPAGAAVLGHPTALIARLDPLRAEYHPWLASAEPALPVGAPSDPDAVAARLEAIGDPETGLLPVVEVDELPQLPAGLARCRVGAVLVCGIGADTVAARLSAAIGAAERLLVLNGGVPVVVGADARHAEGVLLRRLVRSRRPAAQATEVAEAEWARSREARRWLKAVTLRFGVQADLRVHRPAPGVYHAQLHAGTELLGWAVENTAADAAAFCALAAAGTLQWRAAGGDRAAPVHAPCGAAPAPTADTSGAAPWQTDAWIWPAPASGREDGLQHAMRQLLGLPPTFATPVAPSSGLPRALAAAGFVTLEVAP